MEFGVAVFEFHRGINQMPGRLHMEERGGCFVAFENNRVSNSLCWRRCNRVDRGARLQRRGSAASRDWRSNPALLLDCRRDSLLLPASAILCLQSRDSSFSGTDTATGQNVALLTRVDPSRPLARSDERVQYPVPGSSCGLRAPKGRKLGAKVDSSGVSKHFLARFVLQNPSCNRSSSSSCASPALDISLIAAHLVPKPVDPRACAQREAQATGAPLVARREMRT